MDTMAMKTFKEYLLEVSRMPLSRAAVEKIKSDLVFWMQQNKPKPIEKPIIFNG